MHAPVPASEAARLKVLRDYEILDTPPEEAFDELALLASHVCDAPMALITLVDESRQWFKARVGVTVQETPRQFSFCAHTMIGTDLLVVPDARADSRFSG